MMKFYTAAFGSLFIFLFNFASAQNNALNFDGVNDYIKIPNSATHDVTNAVTIEAWVYPTNTNWDNILMKGNYGYGFALSGNGGAGACGSANNLVYWDQSQCGSTVRSSVTYALNTWQHTAVTVEDLGTQLRVYFYLNGVQNGPFLTGQTDISNGGIDHAIYIGAQGLGLGNFFAGNMDEVRVWNVVRTQSEIQSAMNIQINPATQPGLVAYFSFNQGIGGGNNAGITTANDATANANNGTLTNFALNGSTSNWVGAAPIILPVQLLSFRAASNAGAIHLEWATAQEQNSNRFEIERSSQGNHFNRIGTVNAAGNSTARMDYHFTDPAPASGNNYYRLKQIDADGKFKYSLIVEASVAERNQIKLQVNPVHSQVKVVFLSEIKDRLQLVITDAAGASLIKKTVVVQPGTNEITVPVSGIRSGLYYLQAKSQKWNEVLKFSKL